MDNVTVSPLIFSSLPLFPVVFPCLLYFFMSSPLRLVLWLLFSFFLSSLLLSPLTSSFNSLLPHLVSSLFCPVLLTTVPVIFLSFSSSSSSLASYFPHILLILHVLLLTTSACFLCSHVLVYLLFLIYLPLLFFSHLSCFALLLSHLFPAPSSSIL